jgi:hypothetical protein
VTKLSNEKLAADVLRLIAESRALMVASKRERNASEAAVKDLWSRLLTRGARFPSSTMGWSIVATVLQAAAPALVEGPPIQVGDHVRRRADRNGKQHPLMMRVMSMDDATACCMWLDQGGRLQEGNFRIRWLEGALAPWPQ